MKVIKRNGEVVPYDFGKIEKAVTSAFKAVTKEDPTPEFYNFLGELGVVIGEHYSATDTIEVEIIQDIIEYELMSSGYFEIAKAYLSKAEANFNELFGNN
jgi:anaerobic ribonucleoside-triphosphate reductase